MSVSEAAGRLALRAGLKHGLSSRRDGPARTGDWGGLPVEHRPAALPGAATGPALPGRLSGDS